MVFSQNPGKLYFTSILPTLPKFSKRFVNANMTRENIKVGLLSMVKIKLYPMLKNIIFYLYILFYLFYLEILNFLIILSQSGIS